MVIPILGFLVCRAGEMRKEKKELGKQFYERQNKEERRRKQWLWKKKKENNRIHHAFNRKWHALFTQAQNYVLKR